MRFKIISFDVEGTLVSHKFSEIIWEKEIPRLYAEKVGISINEAVSYIKMEYDKIGDGRIEWYDIRYWFNRFGLNDYQELLNEHKDKLFHYPDVEPVLEKLSRRFKLIINSNSAREFLNFETEKIKKYFLHIFSAPSDFKLTKKTIDVHREICMFLKVKPSEVIHVGDNWEHDFVTPRKIGILSFYLDRKKERRGEFILSSLGEFERRIARALQ